jgi:hypothetical protein
MLKLKPTHHRRNKRRLELLSRKDRRQTIHLILERDVWRLADISKIKYCDNGFYDLDYYERKMYFD